MFLRVCAGFWSLWKHVCVWLKISGCKFQKSFWVWVHSRVYMRNMHIITVCKCCERASSLCCVCLLPPARAWFCVCACGVGRVSTGNLSDILLTPHPPAPPSRDELSWMLMFCDGCGANKCFWHSTGSHYRSRPNGLARALMSRQVSQPQPPYRSHTLLMQGQTTAYGVAWPRHGINEFGFWLLTSDFSFSKCNCPITSNWHHTFLNQPALELFSTCLYE